jgi:hypothetical protein
MLTSSRSEMYLAWDLQSRERSADRRLAFATGLSVVRLSLAL